MPRNRIRDNTFGHIKNPKAKQNFLMCQALWNFLDEQDYHIIELEGRLRKDTIKNAAAILHDAAMVLEYGPRS